MCCGAQSNQTWWQTFSLIFAVTDFVQYVLLDPIFCANQTVSVHVFNGSYFKSFSVNVMRRITAVNLLLMHLSYLCYTG